MKYKNLALILALGLSVSACGNNGSNNSKEVKNESKTEDSAKVSEDKTKDNQISSDNVAEEKVVYTSFYPIYNIAKQIAGDKMEVRSFTNLKSESHGWEPSAKDIAELSSSNLMFINGAGMEEWEDSVKGSTDVELVNTSEDVELIKADHDHEHEDHDHGHEEDKEDHDHSHEEGNEDHDHEHEEHDHEHNHGEFDPHTWLSPKNGIVQAKAIADKLSEVDPANKDYYMANYKKIEDELNAIIDEYSKKFEESENKNFLVNHKAFSYIARDFNLNQIALTSLTSTDDTDAKTLKEAAEKAQELNINTVFYEMGGTDKSAKTLAGEIAGETKALNTLELATDEDLDNNKTYQELIKYNLEEIYKSLER